MRLAKMNGNAESTDKIKSFLKQRIDENAEEAHSCNNTEMQIAFMGQRCAFQEILDFVTSLEKHPSEENSKQEHAEDKQASDSRGEDGFGSTDAVINKLSKVKLEDIVKEFNFRLGTSWALIKSEDGIEAAKVKFIDDTVVWLTLTEDKDLQYLSCAFKNVNGSSLYENVTVLLSSTDDADWVCNFVHAEWRRLQFITASGFDIDETVKLLKADDSVEMASKHYSDLGMLQSIKVVFKDGSVGLLCLPVDTSMREAPEHEHEAACTCLLYANQSSYASGKFYANFNIGPTMLPPYVAKQFIFDCECMKNQ
jgi:hypothetical protein